MGFPDTQAQVSPGAIQGSVFGGHAPIVGAHVYVYEAGHTGTGAGQYAAAGTSLLSSGAGSDANGTYVLTSNSGGFNITGDYTCDAGVPVYLAATGGSPTGVINITSAAVAIDFFGIYFVNFQSSITIPAGDTIVLQGLTGSYAFLNGTTQTVSYGVTGGFGLVLVPPSAISGTTTGTVIINNPAITNMAMLGLCPGVPNEFATTLNFVFMNEVSTAAMAYAMGGFGSGPFNVGAPSTNLTGLNNAALNAGQLYDIQGSNSNVTAIGEGHLARTQTPAGNGVVPQTLLDTIGNILASCVDSSDTANSNGNPSGAGASPNCAQLFTYATSNGVPYGSTGAGTIATDTATAAFNIAHYPAGAPAYSSGSGGFVQKLYALQGSQAIPFNPYLTSAPNDFTVAITYPLSRNSYLGKAESIAVDGTGSIWASAQANQTFFKWSPQGALVPNTTYTAPYIYGYLSIDPSNDVWSGSANSTQGETEVSSSGVLLSGSGAAGYKGPYISPYATVTDSAGNAYVGSKNGNNQSIITEISSTGNVVKTISNLAVPIPSPDDTAHISIDAAGYLWITSENGTAINRVNAANGNTAFTTITPSSQPEVPGIDHSNNAWIALQYSNTVDKITPTGTVTNPTGATLNNPFGSAVDGAGNVWIANRANGGTGAGSIVEYNGANSTAISPSTNYTLGGVLTDALNVAVDGSGDLWITNYGGNQIVEMMGPVAPAVTPLSKAAGSNQLGVRP